MLIREEYTDIRGAAAKPAANTNKNKENGNFGHETYDSPDSARSSALSKSASTMANLRATCTFR